MPDFSGSFAASDAWVTAVPPSEALRRLADAVSATPSVHLIEADLGSPLAYRMWGTFTRPNKVPLHLKIETAAVDQGTRVVVEASSRQGHYVVQVPGLAPRAFQRAFAALFSRLRAVVPPVA